MQNFAAFPHAKHTEDDRENNLVVVVGVEGRFCLVCCGIIKVCKTLRRNCKYYFNIENDKLYTEEVFRTRNMKEFYILKKISLYQQFYMMRSSPHALPQLGEAGRNAAKSFYFCIDFKFCFMMKMKI